jgi:NADH-quinone oxidoreductase subunit G
MVEIELDGSKIEVLEGSMIMHAAEKAGTYIPHFCYHKKLSIAANCRMCLVDVEKAPKPMPACATPVTQGMIVRTKSAKAIKAQQSVMEFLLINHPLDCPICDQGGECQLQDLAVGYGGSQSRYDEEKRVVSHKDVGPLISMEEMSRCIHCTRCVRFGQEVAGIMELGMSHRGEHAEIETFVGDTVDSELSGNMIDICPVGALTSKPFRYSARTWEMGRRKTVSPHDSTGTNLIVQVKNHKVMRVVPLENERINECWIADRDRFSYEALNGPDRLTSPMIKQGGQWLSVGWQEALEYVANGLQGVKAAHGPHSIAGLLSPHSTLEELYLAGAVLRGIGTQRIDAGLRRAQPLASTGKAQWLGTSIESLSHLQRVLFIGGNLRKDHPLFAQRIRQAARRGCQVNVLDDAVADWAMPVSHSMTIASVDWALALAELAAAVAAAKGIAAPLPSLNVSAMAVAMAASLLGGSRKAVLLGNRVAHHPNANEILGLANWIARETDSTVGFAGEAANTVGAQLLGLVADGVANSAKTALQTGAKGLFLLNVEPGLDTVPVNEAALAGAELVVTLSPFKCNMEISDVLLPIAPFTETPGSFVNAEGRLQSFHAVVKPLGDARPAWKVLRVLGEMMAVEGISFETIQDVRAAIPHCGHLAAGECVTALDNHAITPATIPMPTDRDIWSQSIGIYAVDGLVRRSPSLQATRDGRLGSAA